MSRAVLMVGMKRKSPKRNAIKMIFLFPLPLIRNHSGFFRAIDNPFDFRYLSHIESRIPG